MSRCTDTVVTQVLCNLTVRGFLMLLCSCNLAKFRQSIPPLQWVLVGSIARNLVCG